METVIPELLLSSLVAFDMLLHVSIFSVELSAYLKFIILQKLKGLFLCLLSAGAGRS